MSRPPSTEGLERVHIWLKSEDVARVHKYFDTTVGFSKAIRQIVHSYMNGLESRAMEIAGGSSQAEAQATVETLLEGLKDG